MRGTHRRQPTARREQQLKNRSQSVHTPRHVSSSDNQALGSEFSDQPAGCFSQYSCTADEDASAAQRVCLRNLLRAVHGARHNAVWPLILPLLPCKKFAASRTQLSTVSYKDPFRNGTAAEHCTCLWYGLTVTGVVTVVFICCENPIHQDPVLRCPVCVRACMHACVPSLRAAIALLFADELASRPEPMCSPVVTVADRIASGALRRGRTRESQRQGTSTRAHSPTDDDMQLALAMSLSVAHPSNAAIPRASHSSRGSYVREEVIDLRSDDEADDAGVGEATASLDLDLDIDARHNPAWSPTVAATQQTGYSRVQRRAASNSISDATIERLTGLRLA